MYLAFHCCPIQTAEHFAEVQSPESVPGAVGKSFAEVELELMVALAVVEVLVTVVDAAVDGDGDVVAVVLLVVCSD